MESGQTNPVGEGRPVWDDTAPPEDMEALDPGPPDALPRTPDVLVIGGGQIGLAVAAECTRVGLGTLLLEKGRLAGGPSGRNGGFLLADGDRSWPEGWRAAAGRALELHREMDARWHHGVRLMDLYLEDRLVGTAQAHVHPLRLAAAYARNVGTVATRVTASDVELDAGRVTSVRTSHGDVEPGSIVFATGCCPVQARAAGEGYVKGHVIATEPAPFELGRMVVDGEVGAVQLPDGRLVCGGTKEFDDQTTAIVDTSLTRLRDALVRLVPGARDVRISHAWTCFRPHAADHLPILDALPGASNAFVVAGMFATGVLMAPVVAELVRRWITDGTPPADVGPFAMARPALAGSL